MENLERARNFQPVDYSREDLLRGKTTKRTRISFEKDTLTLLDDILLGLGEE